MEREVCGAWPSKEKCHRHKHVSRAERDGVAHTLFLDADNAVLETRTIAEDANLFADPPAGTRAVRSVEQTDSAGSGVDDFAITL